MMSLSNLEIDWLAEIG